MISSGGGRKGFFGRAVERGLAEFWRMGLRGERGRSESESVREMCLSEEGKGCGRGCMLDERVAGIVEVQFNLLFLTTNKLAFCVT